jgi:hypothetical protein
LVFAGVGPGEGFFLEFEVGVEVDLRRVSLFVTEPESDHGCVDAGVEQAHGGVPQGVGGDVLGRGLSPASQDPFFVS